MSIFISQMQKRVYTVDTNDSQSTSFHLKWLVYNTRSQTAGRMAKTLTHTEHWGAFLFKSVNIPSL